MKYGHEYSEALASNEFPTDWVSAAVSYRALKKCIKQVQRELEQYGLDAETLKTLDSSFGVNKGDVGPKTSSFTPELWVAVDEETGQFLHVGLTNTTKQYLHHRKSTLSLGRELGEFKLDAPTTSEEPPTTDIDVPVPSRVTWKLIPLTTVTTFFNSLDPALAGLESIHDKEAARLRTKIIDLGNVVSTATSAPAAARHKVVKASDKDMRIWRQLFELYLETPIFFSTHEVDYGTRSYAKAKTQLQLFSDRLIKTGLTKKFRNKESKTALDAFITLNLDILRIMHFEEMNTLAVRKILKKFDKRTSLGASKAYRLNTAGPLARSIAKDMCAEIQTNVMVVVPQLDDYLCPVCTELAWKPIKLGCCNAIFCIRCVIQLQRSDELRCPMCRSESVPAADSSRIDRDTMLRLQKYFPKEVRIKQAANERAAGVDLYGVNFYRSTCSVM
ncbi:RING-14 protein [Elsinoe ampelina]|uniref:RING-14 protein n=1 Tax=Elsinoe ampelina TaxID=302913 RepID=A0A6A6G1B2_9PEZI|nr:RING-14 protein [Elsinoe ampelina]